MIPNKCNWAQKQGWLFLTHTTECNDRILLDWDFIGDAKYCPFCGKEINIITDVDRVRLHLEKLSGKNNNIKKES